MGPITDIIPCPRPATLGGVPVVVWEARLRELAELQAVLDDMHPDPLDECRDALDAAGPDDRREILNAALARAEAGVPCYGDPSGDAFYATEAGTVAFLAVALKRGNPALVPCDATGAPTGEAYRNVARLARAMTPAEFGRVWRIFHGARTARVIERLILGPIGPAPAGAATPISWGEAFHEVREATGYTFAEIAEMTLSQWRNVRAAGKPDQPEVNTLPRDRAAAERKLAEIRAHILGPGAAD